MNMALRIPRTNIVQATKKHSATLFFFHGSGGCGEDQKEWLDIVNRGELKYSHIKIVYPSAPIQPYTPNGGMLSTVWFDREDISINVPEKKASIDAMCEKASELVEQEVASGIPYNRIIIGGFSMGGALAMHLVYRFKQSVAACLALSCFLNNNSSVYEAIKSDSKTTFPPLLQFHGAKDELVPLNWGKQTNDALKDLGIKADFVRLENIAHELNRNEVQHLSEWISKIVEPEES